MAMHHNVRVDVPLRTYLKKQNNSQYVYYYLSFYRNDEGSSRNKAALIGRLDEESNKLIPNDKYYELFGGNPSCEYEGTFCVGYTAVLDKVTRDLGLDTILGTNSPSLSKDILTVAGYAIREGACMSYIDDYMNKHYCFGSGAFLNSKRTSELFSNIDSEERKGFFSDWIKKCAENDYIAYDVTSISTYSNGIIEAEYGYNRDHEKLKQINIGMFTATKSKLPVYYENYNGSLTDKINLEYVLENAKDVGINSAKLVMDGGFFDEERLKKLASTEHIFTVGMPSTLDASKKLLDTYRSEVYSITNRTSFGSNYAMLKDYEIFGIKGKVLIGLCVDTKELMMESLKEDIARRTKELDDGKIKKYETVIKKKRYTELFEIESKEDGTGYTYSLNEDAVFKMAENFGYFLVFTTDHEMKGNDILYYYRAKDTDEKMFYQLKIYLEAGRIRTHNQETTDGKLFTLFIALIMRSYLYQKLEGYKTVNHLTLEKCFRKLENIQMIKVGNEMRLTKALTKQQKELLEIFEIDIDQVMNRVG